ncbi:MAG: Hsp20/alpha crystallin family protein [Bacteroidota bacterium]|nr:Hsp20/alpha crystallin family protein [Bacteroidota bacterium]
MLPIVRRHRDLPGLFDEFFGRDFFNDVVKDSHWNSTPKVNVIESEKDYSIEVAAPGLEREDFKVNLKNNLLTISSEKECKQEENEDRYLKREFCYTSFNRSFSLPENIEVAKIAATHKNGVLTVVLPKKEKEAENEQDIQIL